MGLRELGEDLSDGETVANNWIDVFSHSSMRLPRIVDRDELVHLVRPVVENLFQAIRPSREENAGWLVSLSPGMPELREVEKSVAFIGGRLVAANFSGFDVAALLFSLRDVLVRGPGGEDSSGNEKLRNEVGNYVEWLAVLALDSFSSARASAERERVREELLEGMPIIHVIRDLPAALLVGQPDRTVLDSVFARLLLAVVRVGAKAVIIDVSGIQNQDSLILAGAVERFVDHPKIGNKVRLLLVGVDPEVKVAWCELFGARGTEMSEFEHFDIAVVRGLALSGHRIVTS